MRKRTKVSILIILTVIVLLGTVIFTIFLDPKANSQPRDTMAATDIPRSSDDGEPAQHAEYPAVHEPIEKRAWEIMAEMSEREKICQMFIVYPEAVGTVTGADETLLSGLESYPVGGFVFSAENLEAGNEVTIETVGKMQEWSKLGLIITADEEGGRVNRLMSTLDTTWIDNMLSHKDMGAQTAYDNAATIAADLKVHGFNTDLAPVADVLSNPENTVIGDRAYSDDFRQAAELVASAVRGFSDSGVICALKHFPGHGDTAEDSHFDPAIVRKSPEQLREEEFLPFIAGIEAGADMVMIGHLTIPMLSDEPATVSREIVTGLLREEIGFDGVVITDSLEMGAITSYETGQLVVKAVNAGIDILLGPDNLARAVEGMELALGMGELTWDRIEESVIRILIMKLENGIIE